MGVVEKLNASCPDKVSYYCSKADTIADDNDRQKVRHHPLRNPYNVSIVVYVLVPMQRARRICMVF